MYDVALPRTRASLAADLRALGLRPGETVLVHCSLKSIGWVAGGALALMFALRDALGPEGTLVVPTHSSVNSDPSHWSNPPVPEAWWPVIREHTPAFDPHVSPTFRIGALADTVRALPEAIRSAHPQVSFAAVGPQAQAITADHALEDSLGERSPLAALESLGGRVLLLGVGFDCNTIFHLAEYRYGGAPRVEQGSAVLVEGERRWVPYADVDLDSDDFPAIGEGLLASGAVIEGLVGSAPCKLFGAQEAAAYALEFMQAHRVKG